MSAVIAWTCKSCGHHASGLSVDEYVAAERDHVCRVADQIRRAVAYFRRRPTPTMNAVADWLEDCARNAEHMADPEDFGICDEPGSVRHALLVAQATPWDGAS